MGSRGRPQTCDECEENKVTDVFCPECDQWMCKECDVLIHKKGRRARHVRRYQDAPDGRSRSSTDEAPPMPPSRPGAPPPPRSSPTSGSRHTNSSNSSGSREHLAGGPTSRAPIPPSHRLSSNRSSDSTEALPPPPPSVPPSLPPPSSVSASANAPPLPVPVRIPPPLTRPPSALQTPQRSFNHERSLTEANVGDSRMSVPSLSPSLNDSPGGGGVTRPTQPKLLKRGMLKKKKKKGFRVYQERDFQLWTHELQYYRKKNDKEPAGTILLRTMASVVPIVKDKTGKRFDILTNDQRTFELQASTAAEAAEWVDVISDALKQQAHERESEVFSPSLSTFTKGLSSSNLGSLSFNQPASSSSASIKPPSVGSGNHISSASMSILGPGDGSTREGSYVDDGDVGGEDSDDEDATGEVNLNYKVTGLWKGEFSMPYGELHQAQDADDAEDKSMILAIKKSHPNCDDLADALKKTGSLDHPHIMRQMGIGESSDVWWAIYRPPGKSVAQHLNIHLRFPEKVVRTLGAQILSALEYLHDKGLSFPLMSSQTIYLEPESGNAHVVDFLLCLDGKHRSAEPVSPEYICPDSNKVDRRADWWRFGILLYEMAVGFPPLRSSSTTYPGRVSDIAKELDSFEVSKLAFPPFVSHDFQNIITKLLNKAASQRLGGKAEDAEDVKRQPWFRSGRFDWSSLHTHTIPWLNDHAVDHTCVNYHRVLPTARFKHGLTMELIQADNLPPENKGMFCQIQCEQTKFQSEVLVGSNPQWNGVYNFDVKNLDAPEGRITVLVVAKKGAPGIKGGDQLIGSVEFAIPEIWSQHEQNEGHALGGGGAEFISSIIDMEGFPTFAELHVKFHLNTTKEDTPSRSIKPLTIPLKQSFKDYFGNSLNEESRTRAPSIATQRSSYSAVPPPVMDLDDPPDSPPESGSRSRRTPTLPPTKRPPPRP
eukprot:gb/GEZN01001539.1/.p1 GENE.gb/GEZN01001539.1/~~gb/GEZN01001539.1/.p1  ORF type:complete len:938 (-),score=145.49 gb/GEZN01001539.1/:101-2914(-)